MRASLLVVPFLLVMTGSPADITRDSSCSHAGAVANPASQQARELVRPGPAAAPRSAAAAPGFALDLNIPANRLDAYDGGVRTRRYTVSVGMPGFRTPRGEYEITSVEWNPWWIPPDREWARNEHQTPPGPSNPMGRVKLNFLPLYFLHGTPAVQSLGRAVSHGCVRMSNADAIALALRVHDVGTPALARASLDSLVADTSLTRLILLEVPVPIRIRYDVAEVTDDTLFLYRDVYSLDRRSELQRALDALSESGIELERIHGDRLRNSMKSTSRRPLPIPLSSLLDRVPGSTIPRP